MPFSEFRDSVGKVACCEVEGLAHVLVLEFGILPHAFCSIWVVCGDFDNATHGQPQATKARLSVHSRGIDGYPVKALHDFQH